MPGTRTNEAPGTRATLRYCRTSAFKAREVLDLIRGKHVAEAGAVLRFSERDVAQVVAKVLASAVANAQTNDGLSPEELFVSTCYADEATTIRRWRPRARGRATRIRRRTCHITVIVSRLPEEQLHRLQTRAQAEAAQRRARRVAGGRRGRRRHQEEPAEAQEDAGSARTAVPEEAPTPAEDVTDQDQAATAVAGSEPEDQDEEKDD